MENGGGGENGWEESGDQGSNGPRGWGAMGGSQAGGLT